MNNGINDKKIDTLIDIENTLEREGQTMIDSKYFLTKPDDIFKWLRQNLKGTYKLGPADLLGSNDFKYIRDPVYGFKMESRVSIDLSNLGLAHIPVKFSKVSGKFNCSGNQLTSLEFAPQMVVGDFNISDNLLTSLRGGPEVINGAYRAANNELTTLTGLSSQGVRYLDISHNKITSLKGCPEKLQMLLASHNHLRDLNFLPIIKEIKEGIDFDYNPDLKIYEGVRAYEEVLKIMAVEMERNNLNQSIEVKNTSDLNSFDHPNKI